MLILHENYPASQKVQDFYCTLIECWDFLITLHIKKSKTPSMTKKERLPVGGLFWLWLLRGVQGDDSPSQPNVTNQNRKPAAHRTAGLSTWFAAWRQEHYLRWTGSSAPFGASCDEEGILQKRLVPMVFWPSTFESWHKFTKYSTCCISAYWGCYLRSFNCYFLLLNRWMTQSNRISLQRRKTDRSLCSSKKQKQ